MKGQMGGRKENIRVAWHHLTLSTKYKYQKFRSYHFHSDNFFFFALLLFLSEGNRLRDWMQAARAVQTVQKMISC